MIETFIQKTNKKEFYQDCDLKLESLNYKTAISTLEIHLSINQIDHDIPIEHEEWKLTCKNTEKYGGFFWDSLMPYVKLAILNKHPLLLNYHENKIECELDGKPQSIAEFIGDITNVLEKKTGNWITTNDFFWNTEEFYKKYSKKTFSIPESLTKSLKEVCKKHNLEFVTFGKDKRYAYKPQTKVLIFGNTDISPNEFKLSQPFVIAEDFIAERIK